MFGYLRPGFLTCRIRCISRKRARMRQADGNQIVAEPMPKAYSDSPELAHGLIPATLQMLAWVIFHPTAWVRHLSRSNLSLAPDFCLVQLNVGHLRRPQIRQLLLSHFVIWPIFVAVSVAVILLVRGASAGLTWFGVAHGLAIYVFIGLIIGGLNNAGAGAWGVFGGVVGGSLQDELDLNLGVSELANLPANLHDAIAVCAIHSFLAGAVGALLIALAAPKENRRFRTHVTAIAWGVVAGVLVGCIAGFLLTSFPRGFTIVATGGPLFAVAVAVIVAIQTNSLHRSLLFGTAFFLLTFGLSALLLSQKGSHSFLSHATRGFLTGMSFQVFSASQWGTVFMWPLECLWNQVVLRLDETTPSGDPSRLPMNAAFWDEHQWLRLWGLDKHIVRAHDRSPAEAAAALRYLEGGKQDWARAAARAELDARILDGCKNIEAIIGRLNVDGENVHIRFFVNVSEDVKAAVNAPDRQKFRKIEDALDNFILNTRWYNLFARRLGPVANAWSRIIKAYRSSLGLNEEARVIKVLLLSANPIDDPLSIDAEFRAIDTKIRGSDHRDHVQLILHGAVRLEDVPGLLMRHKPHVVHFSGHGNEDGIALTTADGSSKVVPPKALANIFNALKDNVRVVLLNVCDSAPQAEAIVGVIDCAVGMDDQIGDDAAVAFAAAFYETLGYGRSVKTAFDLALVQLTGAGEDRSLAKLYKRRGVRPAEIVLVAPVAPASPR